MDMRLVWAPRPVFLLLLLALVLVMTSLFQSISKQGEIQFSANPLCVFLLFNIIILSIIVGDHRPSAEEVDSILPFLYSGDATNKIEDEDNQNHSEDVDDRNDESEQDDPEDFDSDGYNEDDDDNGSDDEIGWEDRDEDDDDNLERRIEDFIDRVYKGWQEERSSDNLCKTWQFFAHL